MKATPSRVEAAVEGMEGIVGMSEVPLADESGPVAGGAQTLGERDLGDGESHAGSPVSGRAGVELVPEALLVAAGH
jgi:hypothetical protein